MKQLFLGLSLMAVTALPVLAGDGGDPAGSTGTAIVQFLLGVVGVVTGPLEAIFGL